MDLIFLSKYFWSPTLNNIREKTAIKIDGTKVVVENKIRYLKVKKNQKAPNFKLDSTDSKVFELSKVKNGIFMKFNLQTNLMNLNQI